MTVDPAVVPGLLLLALELLALAAVGYVVARVALRQTDDRMALAQGLVIGPALWGLIVSFLLHLITGRAGALAGWVLLGAIGGGLAWREREALRLPLRTAAVFVASGFVIFWVVLASRQTLSIPDANIHLGLASYFQAGGYPPTLPWNPGQPASYHFGVDMLIGLLAPPFGPDLAFATELLSVYIWIGLALVVATTILQRVKGLVAMVLTPLLLTAGAWTLVASEPPGILQIPVQTAIPAAGLRASLASVYWPEVSLPWQTRFEATPPNIWKPLFVLGYALAFVALERIARGCGRSWPGALTLAAVIGFVGLVDEPIALVTIVLWGLLEVWPVLKAGRVRSVCWKSFSPAVVGLALAVILLVVSGGAIADILFGSSKAGLSLGWTDDVGSRLPVGGFSAQQGGLGILVVGPALVAFAAFLLAGHQRLVLALAVGSGVFLLAALVFQYAPAPQDVTRFDGHARNFALLSLMVALSERLARLRRVWCYGAAAFLFALVTWPTSVGPVRGLALGLSRGVHLANVQPNMGELDSSLEGRYGLESLGSEIVASYIREHTSVDDRVLSPHPHVVTTATGRPNASGFSGLLHLHPKTGPEYADALRFLEPAAIRRLGFTYVHATDAWIGNLPDRARRWLSDPGLLEPLVRDGTDALYRIKPEFLRLDPAPADQSFESLRRSIPASATVYLTEALHRLDNVRLASVLAHTELSGEVDPTGIHLLTEIASEPLGSRVPDIVIVPQGASAFFYASARALAPTWQEPVTIWRSYGISAYASSPTIAPDVNPVPEPDTKAGFAVRLSRLRTVADEVSFTATFTNGAPTLWTGQDWLMIRLDDTPWALPTSVESDRYTIAEAAQWYAGQIVPVQLSATYVFEFDPRAARLAVRDPDGGASVSDSSGSGLAPGVWALAVRLRHGYLQAAVIPVLKVAVSELGNVSYAVYQGELSAVVNPCPEQLQHTESCRRLAAIG